MNEQSDLRDKIARALLDSNGETDCDHCYGLALRDADAVLAVLADLPDDVIERAAEGLHDAAFGQELPEAPIDLARAALRAAFGGEQNDG